MSPSSRGKSDGRSLAAQASDRRSASTPSRAGPRARRTSRVMSRPDQAGPIRSSSVSPSWVAALAIGESHALSPVKRARIASKGRATSTKSWIKMGCRFVTSDPVVRSSLIAPNQRVSAASHRAESPFLVRRLKHCLGERLSSAAPRGIRFRRAFSRGASDTSREVSSDAASPGLQYRPSAKARR